MPDGEESTTVPELNGVTVHMVGGTNFNVEYVIRHLKKGWAYANRLGVGIDGNDVDNDLVLSTEDIIAIDSRHIKMTNIPDIRIHHSGTGSDYTHEPGELAWEFSESE